MYRLRFLLAACLLAIFSSATVAADLTTPEQARDFANQIILDIGQSRLNEAWVKMKSNSTAASTPSLPSTPRRSTRP